jgi:hypothetical protein
MIRGCLRVRREPAERGDVERERTICPRRLLILDRFFLDSPSRRERPGDDTDEELLAALKAIHDD